MAQIDSLFDVAERSKRHLARKEITYEIALQILKEIAMDRISTVIPAHILLTMSEEVQKEIQRIDRFSAEFCALPWSTSKDEQRRDELERQIELINKWRLDFIKTENEIHSTL